MLQNRHSTQQLDLEAEASLDLALEGKSPEVKACVRNLVLKRRIHSTDPLWEIIIALDILRALIEDGPREWEGLFQSFQGELDAWTSSNLQMLTALADEAEALQRLIQSSEQISVAMQTLALQKEASNQQVQDSTESSAGLLSEWREIVSQLKHQQVERQTITTTQKEQLGILVKAVQQLNRKLDRPLFLRQTSWKGIILVVAVVYTLVFSAISMTTLVLYLWDRPLLFERGSQNSIESGQ